MKKRKKPKLQKIEEREKKVGNHNFREQNTTADETVIITTGFLWFFSLFV